jgi:4-amino-4-deoxy-L-arabinose transferase-like glycosyltransferase
MGVLTGFPWLVNPILAGGTIVIAYNWLKRLYDRRTASCVILLLAVSPWFLFMSANLMTHTSSLFWGSLALSAACRFPTKRKLRAVLVGGFSLGMVFLTRPLEGLILGSAVGIWMLSIGKRRELILISAVAILVGSLSLVNNTLLTGKATYFPMEKYFDTHWYPGANGIGFGPNKGNVGWEHIDPLPGHGLLDVIVNANQNFFLLNFETFGWGFGSLLIALFFLYLRSWRRADKLMILILVAVIAGNSLYFFSGGPEYGARYWYLVLIPLTVLTVRSIHTLQKRWQERGGTQQPMLRVSVLLAVASLLTLVTFMPWRSIGKYYHLRGMRDDLGRWARSCTTDDALVFVQEQDKSDYPSAAIFNPLTLDETGPIFARDAGPVSREAVVSKFPDRPIWIVAGSAILGGQFTILEGPRSDLVGLSASLAAKRCA